MNARVQLESTDNKVGWLRFDSGRPANALTRATLQSIAEHIAEAAKSALRVVIITGTPDAFANGADLDEMVNMDADGFRGLMELEFALFRSIEALPMATIAALSGPCSGNGAELALTCDLRVAARSAKLSLPEARIGFTGPAGRLSRFIGIGQAKDILLTGRSLGAEEALAMGLYSTVVDDRQLDEQTSRVAARLARVPATAIRATKVHVADVYGGNGFDEQEMMRGALATFDTPELKATMAGLLGTTSGGGRPAGDAPR